MLSKDRSSLKNAIEEGEPYSYVLITCGKPSKTGDMEINMTYQGDMDLISYLLDGAQSILDQKETDS
jgi:hypothetical protein